MRQAAARSVSSGESTAPSGALSFCRLLLPAAGERFAALIGATVLDTVTVPAPSVVPKAGLGTTLGLALSAKAFDANADSSRSPQLQSFKCRLRPVPLFVARKWHSEICGVDVGICCSPRFSTSRLASWPPSQSNGVSIPSRTAERCAGAGRAAGGPGARGAGAA
jgi:hypothetical protein